MAAIVCDGIFDHIERSDVAIVLGNSVIDGRPSPRLRARLDKAAELFHQNVFGTVIVSGGIDNLGQDEAAVMKEYLVEAGLPAACIFEDNAGNTTALTAKNAAQIMRSHQLRSALVISQYFHITRTKMALRKNGVYCAGSAHANFVELRDVYSIGREWVGCIAYWLR